MIMTFEYEEINRYFVPTDFLQPLTLDNGYSFSENAGVREQAAKLQMFFSKELRYSMVVFQIRENR